MTCESKTVEQLPAVTHVSRAMIDGKPLKITMRRLSDAQVDKGREKNQGPICRECGRSLSDHDARTGEPHLFKPVGPRK